MITFEQELFLTVLDKGLIGILLAIAGFWLNRYLEAFKSRRALESELIKTRDQKELELVQSQLSQFYWPVYLRLQIDNVVWERILQRQSNDPVRAALAHRIETDFILPNHEATCKIIESNIHLAAPNPELLQALLKYVRHVAVYRAIRATGNTEVDPVDVGEPWPADVFPIVEKATLARQKGFESLLQQYSPSMHDILPRAR
jgi:hypothetical protein